MVKAPQTTAMGKKLELAIAILNGAVGDHLDRTGNGLATSMGLVHRGRPLPIERSALADAYPAASGRLVILVHGLMCTEDVWTHDDGADYGSLLERDLDLSPLYLRYNSGLAIATNGRSLDALLSSLVLEYPRPIEEIVLLGYSMGGLVVRSACHAASTRAAAMASSGDAAEDAWLPLVRRAIYVGTPHLGAPSERAGRYVARVLRRVDDPYTRLVAEVADLRSEGVKDLGDARHPVPLLPRIQHYLVAGSLTADARLAALFGDSVVPLGSATDGACFDAATFALPPSHVRIASGTSHVRLARDLAVYAHVKEWCAP